MHFVEPFVSDILVCANPVTHVYEFRRFRPNLDTTALVITEICDPVSTKVRIVTHWPDLSCIRNKAVPRITFPGQLAAPTNAASSVGVEVVVVAVVELLVSFTDDAFGAPFPKCNSV
jgi:hypothetical protein